MMANGIRAHHRLRAALARYDRCYDALDADGRRQVDRDAERALAVEAAVLASPEAAGVTVLDGKLDDAVAKIRGRYKTQGAFAEDMRRNGLCEKTLRAALHRELTVEAVFERLAAAVPEPGEAELVKWYDAHRRKFALPEMRTASHILITDNEDFAENRRDAALARIGEIGRLLANAPDSFGKRARRYSECPSAVKGGRLGRVAPGTLYPALDAALFSLDEGACSGAVETEIGFHIVRCEKIHPARIVPFDEARGKIRAAINARRRKDMQIRWLKNLMNARTVTGKERAEKKAVSAQLERAVP
jgi:peptidyl-prolyl cis-trans isomerase C